MSGLFSIPVAFLGLYYFTGEPKKIFLILAGVGFCAFVIKLVSTNYHLIGQNRPVLLPKLIIDLIENEKITYHFEITNSGKFTASEICWSQKADGFYDFVESNLRCKELVTGGTISIDSIVPFEIPKGSFWISIILLYHANRIEYKGYHKFVVPEQLVRPGIFFPVTSNEKPDETKESIRKDHNHKVTEQIDKPRGSITFRIKGQRGVISIQGSERSFQYNPFTKMAEFVSKSDFKKPIILKLPLKDGEDKDHWYFVAMSWSEKGSMLCVDESKVCEPENFGD